MCQGPHTVYTKPVYNPSFLIQNPGFVPFAKINVHSLPLFITSSSSALSQEPLTRTSFVQKIADPGSEKTDSALLHVRNNSKRPHTQLLIQAGARGGGLGERGGEGGSGEGGRRRDGRRKRGAG